MNVNAGNAYVVPSHTNRFGRQSTCGRKCSAWSARTVLFTPSDARIRSASAYGVRSPTSTWNSSFTPRCAQRRCRRSSSACRDIPAKPCPAEVTIAPPKWISMSSQWANERTISSWVSGSASANLSRVASENTTPNPKVSSGRFRSRTVTSCSGSAFFMRAAK